MEKEILAIINYIYYKQKTKKRRNSKKYFTHYKKSIKNITYLERRYPFLKKMRWRVD